MPYVAFHELCPEVAQRETRGITLPEGGWGLPPGYYEFVEMYCDEPGCDCRRVMFTVFSRNGIEAILAWGWEHIDFYEEWLGGMGPHWARKMKGPALDVGSPQTENAPALLNLAEALLLSDPVYVARLKRHYAMFRQKIDRVRRKEWGQDDEESRSSQTAPPRMKAQKQGAAGATVQVSERVGRNDPCPCGSGKKFKLCCLR